MKQQRWTGIYLAGMVLVCACSREGPTTSREVPSESIIDLARATTLSGQVVTTMRSFAGDNILGTTIASEAHRFSGVVSRSGLTVAEVESSAGSVELTVAGVGSIASAAYSTHALNRSTFTGSEQRSIARTLAEDGRTALATYRRGGTILATVATERTPVRGGWLISRRTYTTYRDGRPLHSVEEVLSDWVVTEGSGGLLPSLGPAMWSGSTVPVGEAAAEGGGDCQAEFDAMFDGGTVGVDASRGVATMSCHHRSSRTDRPSQLRRTAPRRGCAYGRRAVSVGERDYDRLEGAVYVLGRAGSVNGM